MSKEHYLYLRNLEFPEEEWQLVLAEFESKAIAIPRSNPVEIACWGFNFDEAYVSAYLSNRMDPRYVKPAGAGWQLLLHRVDHKPRTYWLQLAIAYKALIIFEDAVFMDAYSGDLYESPETMYDFARRQIKALGINKFFKLGLVDGNGNPIFEPHPPINS